MNTRLLLFVFALVLSSCMAAELVLLGDYEGAVCIDGTPGGFYFVPGDEGMPLKSHYTYNIVHLIIKESGEYL